MVFTQTDYEKVLDQFNELSDKKYKRFNDALTPGSISIIRLPTPILTRLPMQRRREKNSIKKEMTMRAKAIWFLSSDVSTILC